jgi:hypothetical protein
MWYHHLSQPLDMVENSRFSLYTYPQVFIDRAKKAFQVQVLPVVDDTKKPSIAVQAAIRR